jgi:hypothetical protein
VGQRLTSSGSGFLGVSLEEAFERPRRDRLLVQHTTTVWSSDAVRDRSGRQRGCGENRKGEGS